MELKKIAILGPGGSVGSAIITELIKTPETHSITAISRSTSSYTPPADSNIIRKTIDYTSLESLKEAFTGQDAVINCITGRATQYEPSKLIIDAAVDAGVSFYFANEFVGNIDSEQFKRLPKSHAGAKARIREYLGGLGKEGKMKWTALNGGPFFEMWLMKGPAGFDVPNRGARIYGTCDNHLYWTPLSTISLAAANMLRNPGAVANRAIYICPFPKGTLTQKKLFAVLEHALATKFTVTQVDIAKINGNAKIALERGDVTTAMRGFAISNQFYEGDSGNCLDGLTENELVGVEEMSVEEAVKKAIEQYGDSTPVVESMYRVEPCDV